MPTLNGLAWRIDDVERVERLARERAAAAVGDGDGDHQRQADAARFEDVLDARRSRPWR